MFTERSVLLLGPPGVGKTTIGRPAAVALNARFMDLDDFVRPVYDPSILKRPMMDSEVNEALRNLLDACRPGDMVEFSHHDYPYALSEYQERFDEKPISVLCIAEPDVCYKRNSLRHSPVPRSYVERCIQSTQQLLSRTTDHMNESVCVLETERNDVEQCVNQLVNFINRGPNSAHEQP